MKDFRGKVAVITGGASGIGLATARALAGKGAKLVLADIEAPRLAEAVSALRDEGADVLAVETDVADKRAVDALADRSWSHFGAVNIVFNNAGVVVFGDTPATSHDDWTWTMNVNLWGPIHGVEAFVPRMIEQKQEGHVLFTASFAGLVANKGFAAYCVTKSAVVSLAECLHKDLRDHDIGVSVLCPMRVESQIDFAARNRPQELGGPDLDNSYSAEEHGEYQGRTLPVEPVAGLILDAIRDKSLYILTHPEAGAFIARRSERLLQAAERGIPA